MSAFAVAIGVKRTCSFAMHKSARPKADIAVVLLPAVTYGSHAVLRLHLFVSINEKMIEIFDTNKAESRILHVCESIECDSQRPSKNQHVNPTARLRSRHAEARKQR